MLCKAEICKTIELRVTQRKFLDRPLLPAEVARVKSALKNLEPLEGSTPLQWYYSEHFPAASGIILAKMNEFTTNRLIKFGFEGEQIVLNLTLEGFSTSWARLPNYLSMIIVGFPKEGERENMERAAYRLYRSVNRKPLEELVTGKSELLVTDKDLKEILMAGRLAPSAFNRQPWNFEIISDREVAIHGWKKLPSIYEEVIAIDLGVVLSHVYLTAKAIKGEAKLTARSGRTYIVSW